MIKGLLRKTIKALKALLTRKIRIECDCIPYSFDDVPLKKIINWILVEVGIHFKSKSAWGMPTHVQLEPSTHCNLRCALCPVTEGMERPTGYMSMDMFKRFVDDAADYLFLILMWDWGEPFMNPNIYDMISYAKQKGISVVSSTNGHLFAREENAEKLVQSGIDSIIVAVDGITQDTYGLYRRLGKLDVALDAIRNIVAKKKEMDSDTPLVNLRFVVMKHNEDEISTLKKVARDLGVDALSLKTLNPYSNDMYCEKRALNKKVYDSFIPKEEVYRRFQYVEEGDLKLRVRRAPPCKSLWNTPTIHWDGTVCICTYDYNEMYVLGDISKEGLGHVWQGETYRRVRRQFRESWEQLRLCRHCSYSYEGGSCWNETIAEVYYSPHQAEIFSNPDNRRKVKALV